MAEFHAESEGRADGGVGEEFEICEGEEGEREGKSTGDRWEGGEKEGG